MMLLLVILTGCKKCDQVDHEFPPGLEPIAEVNEAPLPTSVGDALPEALEVVTGEAEGGGYYAHARGYVRAPIDAVRAALGTPEVVANRRRINTYEVTEATEPEYDASFTLHAVVHSTITVRFDVAWRLGALDDGAYAARWQLTRGPAFIDGNEGSVVLEALDDETTLVSLMHVLDAPRNSEGKVAQTLEDLHASLAAAARNEPLPTY